jgi:hypothetical protein
MFPIACLGFTDIRAGDAEALVNGLDLSLEFGEAVLHLRRSGNVEVVLDKLGDGVVAVVEARKHGGSEGPARGPRLVTLLGADRPYLTRRDVGSSFAAR